MQVVARGHVEIALRSTMRDESLLCPPPRFTLSPPHLHPQPVFMADHQYGTVGLLARRKVSTGVCPDPQPFVPETVSQGVPVHSPSTPPGICLHGRRNPILNPRYSSHTKAFSRHAWVLVLVRENPVCLAVAYVEYQVAGTYRIM